MDKRTSEAVKAFLREVARQNDNLVAAYLFGSYASKRQNTESDIDLALVIEHLNEEERFDVQVQLMLLASRFDSRIEPHPISLENFNVSNPFAAEIINTGIKMKTSVAA